MTKSTKNFTITAEFSLYSTRTMVELTNGEKVYKFKLKSTTEKEAINDLLRSKGLEASFEEAADYFLNLKERIY